MDLVSRLSQDVQAALKAGQKDRLNVLRMLLSDAKTADLKKMTPEQAVAAYAKKLAKSIEEYQNYGKTAEAEQLKRELAVVQEYLPQKASPQETERLIEQFLAEHPFTARDFGKAMGAFMKAHGSQVDAATADQILRRKLNG